MDPFARLGAAMVRFRWVVLGIWLVLLVGVGGVLAPRAAKVLKGGGYVDPGSESEQAAAILDQQFHDSTGNSVAVVFQSPSQTFDQDGFRSQAEPAIKRIEALAGVGNVDSVYESGNQLLVSLDHRTMFAQVALKGDEQQTQEVVPKVRDALKGVTLSHFVTGVPALNYDSEIISEEDLHRSETFTIPIVVVLLLFVFGTVVAAAIPLVIGATAVVMALAIIAVIAGQTNLSIFALNVSSMIGLGLGIDFSLIIVNRFREEIAAGHSPRDAVVYTMATAGRSITYSGVTVLLGMLVLTLLFNLMVIRSISLAVMIVAITALLAGLTLLPALLAVLGTHLEKLPIKPRSRAKQRTAGGFWYRLSHAIMRQPWVWLAVSLALLIAIGFSARDLRLYGTDPGILPGRAESVKGADALNSAFGAFHLTPIQIVLQTDKNGIFTPEALGLIQKVTDVALADPRNQSGSNQGVFSLSTLALGAGVPSAQFTSLRPETIAADPNAAKFAGRFVNPAADTTVITVFSRFSQFSPEHEGFVNDIRHDLQPQNVTTLTGIKLPPGYKALVGGESASFLDFKNSMYSRFPYLIAAVMALTFIVLMMFFQSVFLPLKAIFMNVASIIATYGALVFIFQEGHGRGILGFTELHGLAEFTPVMLFVILFGLSTDYEVFMLSRVKEYYHETGNNEEAVAAGLEHTAGVITAAGLILIGTFGSFASADVLIVKEIGLGLAIGVLLDSTIVRVIMVPATMRLMGSANWWMPAWLKKIVPELSEGGAIPAPAAPALATAGGYNGAASTSGRAEPGRAEPGRAGGAQSALERPALAGTSFRGGAAAFPVRRAPVGRLRSVGGSVGMSQIVLPHARPFRIGRDAESELLLYDRRISRRHATIWYRDGGFFINDLDSGNGTFVNGQEVKQPQQLQPGDQVEIGTDAGAKFVFEQRAAEEAVPAR